MSITYNPNPAFYPNPAWSAGPVDGLAWSAEEDRPYRPAMPPVNPTAPMSTGKRVALAAAALCTIGAGAALGLAVFGHTDSSQPRPAATAATPGTIEVIVPPPSAPVTTEILSPPEVVTLPGSISPGARAPGTTDVAFPPAGAPATTVLAGGGYPIFIGGDHGNPTAPPPPPPPPAAPATAPPASAPAPAQGLPTPTKPQVTGNSPQVQIPAKLPTPIKPEVTGGSKQVAIPDIPTPTAPEVTGGSTKVAVGGPNADVFPGLATGLGLSPKP